MTIFKKCKVCQSLHSVKKGYKSCTKCGFDLNTDPRYKVRVRDQKGNKRAKTASNIKEAIRIEKRFKGEEQFRKKCENLSENKVPNLDNIHDVYIQIEKYDDFVPTIVNIFEMYIQFAKTKKKSWKADIFRYRKWIDPRLGNIQMDQIKSYYIQNIVTEMLNKNMSVASTKQVVQLINRLYNWAYKMDLYNGSNPCKKVELPQLDNFKNNYLSLEEILRLKAVCYSWPNQRISMLFLFLLHTGIRLNEAKNLKWEHIDFDKKIIRIVSSKNPKTAVRHLHISKEAIEILINISDYSQSNYVFANQKGIPLKHPKKTWDRIKKAAQIPDYTIHDLRHTFASYLASQGVSLYTIQKILGHTTPAMTQRYAHLSDKAIKDAVEDFKFEDI